MELRVLEGSLNLRKNQAHICGINFLSIFQLPRFRALGKNDCSCNLPLLPLMASFTAAAAHDLISSRVC